MQEASHHGQVIREYRESRLGITQDELARRVGRSRRTIVNIEQSARIDDVKLRRTFAIALQIPPKVLGLPETTLPDTVVLSPVETTQVSNGKNLSKVVLETFNDNLRMRLDLYYLGSSNSADMGLNAHIEELKRLIHKAGTRDRSFLLSLLSHNYQLKGLIARDQLDYQVAESCFKQASLLAQEAECVELNALTLARQAVMYVWQEKLNDAARLYEAAREMSKRSSPALRVYLATGHAEVQGKLQDQNCLVSLTEARSMLKRVDVEDDHLMLMHSTRPSEKAINDGWSQCHVLLGKPEIAIDGYERSEKLLDLSMTRMRARLYIQYAEALYVSKDMSCCYYAIEGLKLARAVRSQFNIRRVNDLARKLRSLAPTDRRVKELLEAI